MTSPTPQMLADVRAFVQGNMSSAVRLLRGSRGTLDEETGIVTGMTGGTVLYTGPARIRSVSGQTINVGMAVVDTASTVISIPLSAPVPRRDDLVQVLDNTDAGLVTRTFHVDEVESSGFWGDAHRMTCTAWVESSRWGE